MKSFVINLKARSDRLAAFIETNVDYLGPVDVFTAFDGRQLSYKQLLEMGCDLDHNWRDPLLHRVMTRGEVGCFISHYSLWEKCAEGDEPYLILEDDVAFSKKLEDVAHELEGHSFLYLAYAEMEKKGVRSVSDTLEKPCYPYHLSAYILTPEAAKTLTSTDIRSNIIPVDEYLPRMLDVIDAVALKEHACKQLSRSKWGTDIEPASESDYVRDFETHALTVASDETRMARLSESAQLMGVSVTNIFTGEWKGSDMSGPGGGQKLNLLRKHIADLPDHDVVLFTDAYDVFYSRGLDNIVGRFLGFKAEIVFSAEKNLWPDKSLRFPPTHTKYRYLNSGTFIGRVRELKRMLSEDISDSDDDQLYLQKAFLTGRYNAVLDVEGYIFQTHDSDVSVSSEAVYNPHTGCYSCIYHGNGGLTPKAHFDRLYSKLYPVLKYARTVDYTVIGPEMLLIDFMTPSQCEDWIRIAEEHGGFKPHEADKFPSHDIHLKELDLWDEMEVHWRKIIAPITDGYWRPSMHHHLRKAFVMRYSADTQTTLGLHTDASLVTGSVKLNDDYKGATLIFPRQRITNKDIPIGKMILFPGPLTHGHRVDTLTEGTKYSATFWSARYEGDLL